MKRKLEDMEDSQEGKQVEEGKAIEGGYNPTRNDGHFRNYMA